MSAIRFGSNFIKDVRLGASQANAVYLGSTKVWPFTTITEENTARTNYAVPNGVIGCYVTLLGGGGGGGKGYASFNTNRGGGGGGGGGGRIDRTFVPASSLGSTYTVAVGSGGASQANGTASSFSSGSVSLSANGGAKGGDGSSTAGGAGGAGGTYSTAGVTTTGANGSSGGGGGNATNPVIGKAGTTNNNHAGAGGGGGSGVDGFGISYDAGGAGGDSDAPGGAGGVRAGTAATSAGKPGASVSGGFAGGAGGGGGILNGYGSGVGGAGGDYGSGGGGSSATNGTASAGGAGGGGYTLVEWVGEQKGGVVFNAAGSGGSSSNSSTVTGTHNCTGNAVIVAVGITSVSSYSCSVTYGGVAMTQLATRTTGENTVGQCTYLFGLLNPPSGVQTIVGTLTGSMTASMGSVSYAGVSSFGNITTDYVSYPTRAYTAVQRINSPNAMVAQIICNMGYTVTYYNQTQRYNALRILMGDSAGGGGSDFSAVLAAGSFTYWAGIAVELNG